MSNTFFISDLHLFHVKVAMLRGFATVEEHNDALICNWIRDVKPDDQIWVLGDNQASRDTAALEIIAGLPGVKHLIAGNHDPVHSMHRQSHKHQRRYLEVFESVQMFSRRRIEGHDVLLSHFPYGPKVMHPTWVAEEWRDTTFTGYAVSPDGQVRGKFGRVLKQYEMHSGYMQVTTSPWGKQYVHRLVAIAYHGMPADETLEVAHNNGKRWDNRASNLRWATPKENAGDRVLHGTSSSGHGLAGEANPRSILTAIEVAQIRLASESYAALALAYGVSKSTIADIKNGRSWINRPASDHTAEPRFQQYRLPDMGEFLLHGHTHSPERYTSSIELHIGVDAWSLSPVPMSEVVAWLKRMSGATGSTVRNNVEAAVPTL